MAGEDRKIGAGLATLLVAGNMIGSGIFLLPTSLAPLGSSSLIGWILSTVGALLLAAVFAWLARLRPQLRDPTACVSAGLGPLFGMQVGLVYWMLCWVGNGGVALAVTGYLGYFAPGFAGSGVLPTTLVVLWLAVAVNLAGARVVATLGGALLVVGLLPILIAIAVGAPAFSLATLTDSWNPSGQPLSQSIPTSLALVFWAFLGVESATIATAVVRDPARNVPRAVYGGVLLAAAVYIVAVFVIFGVIPAAELARSTAPFADLVARVAGPLAGGLVAACALLKAFGTLAGCTLLMAESGRASAAGGFLPGALSSGPGASVPMRDVLLSGLLVSLALVASSSPTLAGQFAALAEVSVLLTMLIYVYCALSVMRFSAELPSSQRYRVRAACGLASLFCVWLSASANTGSLGWAIALIGLSIAIGLTSRRFASAGAVVPAPT